MPAHQLRRALAACLLTAVASIAPAASAAAYAFAPASAWDSPLAATAAVAPDSAGLVAELNRQVAASGTYVNTTSYSTPVYTVPASQPTLKVALDTSYSPLQQDLLAVPIPAGAVPAKGADAHLVIRQPSTNTMWEFWHAALQPDGWHARWGGKMTGVSTNPGYFNAPFGATATSLPLLGGLMTPGELRAGTINHALALAIPAAKAGSFVWPAQRTDGSSAAATAIPEGTRFRVDPTFNVDAMAAGSAVKAMVRAAQRYGIIVRDQAGTVVFFAEDPTPSGVNPYPTIFGTRWLDGYNALKSFPWSRLQAVTPQPTALVGAAGAATAAPAATTATTSTAVAAPGTDTMAPAADGLAFAPAATPSPERVAALERKAYAADRAHARAARDHARSLAGRAS